MAVRRMRFILCVLFVVLLVSCASEQVESTKNRTVAVWDLEDLSPSPGLHSGLGELLSGQIIETLQGREDYIVVERERLLLALQELNLGTTALADESTRLRLGRLIGARFMVFGGYQVVGKGMRLDIRLVEVETGRVMKAVSRITSAGTVQGWIENAKNAAGEL